MFVNDLMSKEVWTAAPGDTLEDAARLMWDRDVGALPVVDAEQHAVGMITDRDICMAAYIQGKRLHDIKVSDVMSRLVLSCDTGDLTAKAEELMRQGQIRRLPVTDHSGRVVGMFSLNDLARASRHRVHDGVNAEDVATTLAAIGEPTHPKRAASAA